MENARGGRVIIEGIRNLLSDLRLATRSLSQSPGLLIITVISLGVGIGAMTSVFGVANTFLFQGPAGISDPETIVAIYTSEDDGEAFGSSSHPDYQDILTEVDAIDDAAAMIMRTLSVGEGAGVQPLLAEEVTENFFAVTGIQPVIGRGFLPDETELGNIDRVALISHDLWQSDFGGRTDALGTMLRLNGHEHTVIGVMPDGVLSRRAPLEPDVWVPLATVGDEAFTTLNARQNRGRRSLMILARLAVGSSQDALGSQLGVLSTRLGSEYPGAWRDGLDNPRAFSVLSEKDSRLRPRARVLFGSITVFFLGVTGLILLIACANVTTLFLARAANRKREMAVRVALGASRRRLVAMFLTEGLIPGLGAGVVGLIVAAWINQAMNLAVASIPFGIPINVSFGLDGRVVAVAVVLSLVASLVFGIIPALEGSHPNLAPALKGDADGATRPSRLRLRTLLVMAQSAAAVVLLVGATLFVRSLSNAANFDYGLDADRIAIATKQLDADGLSQEEGLQYIRDIQAKLSARPDVEAAHVARVMELTFTVANPTMEVEVEAVGYAPVEAESERFWRNSVTPGYLDMLGITILRGRALEATDVDGAPHVAVVNETFAARLWPGESALGRTFQAVAQAPAGSEQAFTEKRAFQVVGIAKDGTYLDYDDGPTPYYWTSIFQDYASRIVVAARGTVSAEAIIPVLRENVELASGEVQFTPPSSLARQHSYLFAPLQIASRVLRWGGLLGLFLAVIGIYGIVSVAVTQRTKEMAIRMALGAEKKQVLSGVIHDGMRPALLGLAVGMLLAFLGARLLTTILFGVSPMDPAAFAGGTLLLVVAALAASLVPALRALRIDPMQTLREE